MKLSAAITLTERVAWKDKSNGARAARCARLASAYFGDVLLTDVRTTQLDAWATQLEAGGRSDATINRYLSYLSKVFTTAKQRDVIKDKPHFPFRSVEAGRTRVLSRREELRLLDLLPGKHMDTAILLLDTGMRTSELFRLRAEDCNFGLRMIHVWKTKTGKPRSVPMTPRVNSILVNACKQPPLPTVLFSGGPWPFVHAWRRARAKMGLAGDREFVPHMLRHTCATRLLAGGANIATVKQWLGHSTIRTTERYVHMSNRDLLDAAKFLEV